MKSAGWEIGEITQEDESLVRFVVSSDYGEHDVTCVFQESSLESVNCHCRKMEREEIPCAHVFRVLKHFGMRDMARCCVAVRWTMQAKYGLEPERNSSRHVWSEQMDRFRELRNMANTYLYKASWSTVQSLRVIELFKSIPLDDADNDEDDEDGENTVSRTFGPLPAYFSSSNQAFTGKILDPIPIKPKGAPCKKRPKPFHERFNYRNKGI